MLNKSPKILFITRSYPPTVGGMENYSFNLYKGLRKKIEVHLIKNSSGMIGLIPFFIKTFIYTLFKSRRFDIVYCNDALTAFFASPAKFLHNKPIFTTFYGLDITFMSSSEDDKLFLKGIKYIYKTLIRLSLKAIYKASSISLATQMLAKNTLGINSTLIAPGISTSGISEVNDGIKLKAQSNTRKRFSINNDKRLILYLGRLVKRKGAFWFLSEVFPELKDDNHLILAGTGDELDVIKTYLELHPELKSSVTLTGHVNNVQREELYLSADMFIMPNIKIVKNWEGFGITAIEASLRGTPVLASNLEGLTSSVISRKNGLHFKSGDSKDCLKIFKEVLKMNASSSEIQQFTKVKFSIEKMVNDFLIFLEV